MQLIAKKRSHEIWAHYSPYYKVWELYFDKEKETYTGWTVDTLSDAKKAAASIFGMLDLYIS
jgi:hypothetical protein